MVSIEALKCIKVAEQEALKDAKLRSPKVCRKRAFPLYRSSTVSETHKTLGIELYEPSRHPCIISSFPFMLDVMKITSAPKLFQVSFRSCIVSGRPPRSFVSHSIIRSGSMLSWMSREIVDPNVFIWSEPIQMRNLGWTVSKNRCWSRIWAYIPIFALDACWQSGTDTCSSADANTPFEHGRSVSDSGYTQSVQSIAQVT